MNLDRNIHNAIIEHFSGNISEEKRILVDDWLAQGEENKQTFEELKSIWEGASGSEFTKQDLDNAIQRFLRKIRSQANAKPRERKLVVFLRYAAVFIIAFSLPLIFLYFNQSAEKQASNSYTTVLCAYGDKTAVVLPDSSTVWLNSGSHLTFANNFEADVRKLTISGEGYFTVKEDKERPFIVDANGVDVQVFGTEFDVKAYPDEEIVAVTLVKGSVQVTHEDEETLIKPGQKYIFEKKANVAAVSDLTDMSSEIEWINGRLVFRNESLSDLELTLERWFDVEIEFADDVVKTRRFSGILERESILEVISYFGISQYVGYSIKGNVITFYSETVKLKD
ncbi:MAG: DUF4974 domain-containing protein [Draconibacterium sp.]